MAEYPFMSLAVDAYLADTQHLDAQENGAYLLLLMIAWRARGRPQLPDDDRYLARCAKVDPRTWRRIKPTIMAFWQLGSDGFWTQKKQLEVRENASKRVQQQREKARKRWDKPLKDNVSSDAGAYATAMPPIVQPEPEPEPETIDTPKSPRGSKEYGKEADPAFADFDANVWSERWPRNGHNRPEAFRAFVSLTIDEREACKAAIAGAARDFTDTVREEKFRPLLATWIKKRGWESDSAPIVPAPPNVDWQKWIEAFEIDPSNWTPYLGPKPGEPGCRVPPELLVGLSL